MTNILLIEPSSSGLELLPTAKRMKFNIFVFSANTDERIIPEHYRKFIDHLTVIDTYDIDLMFASANKINQHSKLSAIIPGSEYHVPIAAHLSNMFSLPGVSPSSVDRLRIKSETRKCLQQNNIRIPRYLVIRNERELDAIEQNIEFPCVLKPTASAGSMHVSRVNNKNELIHAYRLMRNDTWTELGKGLGIEALVEEYIGGEEYSVEGHIKGSNIHIASITKKFLTSEPLFIEMGHIVPAEIKADRQSQIESYVQDVIHALKIEVGVFHAELRVDKSGPVLMEIAGRLPGCRICDLIQLSNGTDMHKTMILSHLDWPIDTQQNANPLFAGMRYFTLGGKEKFTQVIGVEKLKSMPGFCDFKLLKQAGEYVPPLTTFLGRVAFCIFTAPTYIELKSKLDNAESIISFL